MDRFIQIHCLTHYPPSNPNRDDLGRPKTAVVGGVQRQRISSQSLKRALRTSEVFAKALTGKLGERTQRLGEAVSQFLVSEKQADGDKAAEISRLVAGLFGKIKDEKDDAPLQIEQLAFVSPDEKARAFALAERLLKGGKLPTAEELKKEPVLLTADGAVDIAMFGRMLAASPAFNREAAVQVAHAITTNKVEIEDDYYTAVDDLKGQESDAGAGFISEAGYGSGVYYIYACVNTDLLVSNLAGDKELAGRAVEALVRALASATPSGKINSFAHHVRPEYIMVERGNGQPINLFSAFATPVKGPDVMVSSITALTKKRANFVRVYGGPMAQSKALDMIRDDSPTLDALAAFARTAIEE